MFEETMTKQRIREINTRGEPSDSGSRSPPGQCLLPPLFHVLSLISQYTEIRQNGALHL